MPWIFLLKFIILTSLPLRIDCLAITRHRKHIHSKLHRSQNATAGASKRSEMKRGVNIGLHVKIPTSTEKENTDIKMLEKAILKTLGGTKSDADENEWKDKPEKLLLKPFFQCDQWDNKTRTCWLDRNLGDTVTFSLSTGVRYHNGRPDIVWKKLFAQRDTAAMLEYTLDPKTPSRNIVIGRRGYELRISPITEVDIDENQFSAALVGNGDTSHTQVIFKIRVMPEDLGFVYIGETLDLSIESHVALPLESFSFHWYTEKEGEYWTLPSNMRVSASGLTLRISELREEQEGIVACSAYTNRGVHATKKRFLIQKPASKDVLNISHPYNPFENEKVIKRHMNISKKDHRSQTELNNHKIGKRVENVKPRAHREINEANFNGDRYTIIRDQNNEDLNKGDNEDLNKGDFADDEMNPDMPDAEEKTLEQIGASSGNSSNTATILNINRSKNKYMQDDKVAQLISYCIRDIQCSNHASCIRTNLRQNGFCRCLSGFYGAGIFCREVM